MGAASQAEDAPGADAAAASATDDDDASAGSVPLHPAGGSSQLPHPAPPASTADVPGGEHAGSLACLLTLACLAASPLVSCPRPPLPAQKLVVLSEVGYPGPPTPHNDSELGLPCAIASKQYAQAVMGETFGKCRQLGLSCIAFSSHENPWKGIEEGGGPNGFTRYWGWCGSDWPYGCNFFDVWPLVDGGGRVLSQEAPGDVGGLH